MERIGRDMEPRLVSSNRVSVLHGTGLGSDIPCPQDRNCMSAKGGERHRSDQKQAQRATPRRRCHGEDWQRHGTASRRSPVRTLPFRRLRLHSGALAVCLGMLLPNSRGQQICGTPTPFHAKHLLPWEGRGCFASIPALLRRCRRRPPPARRAGGRAGGVRVNMYAPARGCARAHVRACVRSLCVCLYGR